MHPITGKSFVNLLKSNKSGQIDKNRDFLLVGQERHDVGRPHDEGYPIRGIHKNNFLYLKNYENSRYPACNPETGYGNCDDGPTKSWIVERKDRFYDFAFNYRPEEELYDMRSDPQCLKNLAAEPEHAAKKAELRMRLETMLKAEQDPRETGNAAIFDTYRYLGNRAKKGYAEWEARQKGLPLPEEPKKEKKRKY